MFGNHPFQLFELAEIAERERLDRMNRAAMIAEANRGRAPRHGKFRSLRRGFGAGIIGIGHRVRGELAEGLELNESADAGSLRMAR